VIESQTGFCRAVALASIRLEPGFDDLRGTIFMATAKLWTDEEISANPRVKAVIDDIRATRKSDFVNNFWRALANHPAVLERTWSSLKQVMFAPGALDPLTRELIYIAVSTVNDCTYCIHSHTAAARAKGMSDEQYAELLSIIGMAAETNALANALQVPVDAEFLT
jgi:AhpD family alkylhydroperoxidase